MKGILLAGGKGTRMYPITSTMSKHFITIYDKPMIYYSLSTFFYCNVREVLIISTQRDIELYKVLLGDGSRYGLKLSYAVQEEANGIAEAFIIGKDFIGQDSVCLMLGDNIFIGDNYKATLKTTAETISGACVFGYHVPDPNRFGIAEMDMQNNLVGIEEKPSYPKSDIAVVGIYFYDNDVIEIAESVKPSDRGELEITAVNNEYLRRRKLSIKVFNRDTVWLDTGTVESLADATSYIQAYEKRSGEKVACLEEIAFRNGYISEQQFKEVIDSMPSCDYQDYLIAVLEDKYTAAI